MITDYYTYQIRQIGNNSTCRHDLELFDTCLYLKPRQIESILFALHSPTSKSLLILGWKDL